MNKLDLETRDALSLLLDRGHQRANELHVHKKVISIININLNRIQMDDYRIV